MPGRADREGWRGGGVEGWRRGGCRGGGVMWPTKGSSANRPAEEKAEKFIQSLLFTKKADLS